VDHGLDVRPNDDTGLVERHATTFSCLKPRCAGIERLLPILVIAGWFGASPLNNIGDRDSIGRIRVPAPRLRECENPRAGAVRANTHRFGGAAVTGYLFKKCRMLLIDKPRLLPILQPAVIDCAGTTSYERGFGKQNRRGA
jgi:hypothetical protein